MEYVYRLNDNSDIHIFRIIDDDIQYYLYNKTKCGELNETFLNYKNNEMYIKIEVDSQLHIYKKNYCIFNFTDYNKPIITCIWDYDDYTPLYDLHNNFLNCQIKNLKILDCEYNYYHNLISKYDDEYDMDYDDEYTDEIIDDDGNNIIDISDNDEMQLD